MSLRVWLPLDGDLRNLGCSEVTATASGATVNTAGKIGQCYSFDGSNDFISLSGNTLYNIFKGGSQQFSICFWVYHNDATRAIIFGDYGLSGAIGFNVELGTNHAVRFYWNGSPDKTFNSTSYVAAQGWTHIVITYSGSILNIYRNGILSTDSWSGTLATKNKTAGQFYLGRDNRTGATVLNGRLNDFRIYDHCLSAAEVHEIAQGLVLHYKLDGGVIGNLNLLPDSKIDGTWTYPSSSYADKYYVTTNTIPSGAQYTLSFDAKSTVNGDRIRTFYYNPNTTTTCISSQGTTKTAADGNMDFTLSTNWERYWVVYTQTNTTTVKNIICPRLISGEGSGTVSVKNVKLEEGSVATAWRLAEETQILIEDSSGYNNNAILNKTTNLDTSNSRYTASTYFGAYNTPVATLENTDILPALTNCTITYWAKYDTTKTLLFTGHTTSYYLAASNNNTYYHGNGGTITFYKDGIAGTYKCAADGWHHFAMTGVNLSSWTALKLNGYSSSWPLKGYISDLRIYNTVLSADDILQLYHTSAKVDNQQNFHTFELEEAGGPELLAIPFTTSYGNRTNIYTAYNDDGEITLTGSSSIGSNYIPISPTGKVYYFDIDVSIDAGNQFYIGFERFDVNKAATSNSSCDYVVSVKPSSALVHQHYFGTRTWTANLSTGKPPAYIALRILNDWSGANGRKATIHSVSLREVSTLTNEQILKTGITKADEFIEGEKTAIQKNKIIRSKNFIEL